MIGKTTQHFLEGEAGFCFIRLLQQDVAAELTGMVSRDLINQ